MKNHTIPVYGYRLYLPTNFFIIMKLIVFFTMVIILQASASVDAQKITISKQEVLVEPLLKEIGIKSGYSILYSPQIFRNTGKVSINAVNEDFRTVLDRIFKDLPISYSINEKTIVLKRYIKVNTIAPNAIKDISGKVTDENGENLPGVTVRLKNTNINSITNVNGVFSVNVPENKGVLVFSFIGYQTAEIDITATSTYDVQLVPDNLSLSEFVVVGYGTQKKVNLTGSVDAIKGGQIAERPVSNLSQTLQGVSAGTTVTNSGGAPGSDGASIRIRGIGTFGNNNPLILVDGVQVSSMDNVDPQDVENLSILKDASSAAIYGSRAANGVILITTKRGKNKPFAVSYNGYAGIQSLTRTPKWVSTADYMKLVNEAAINANKEPKYSNEAIEQTIQGTDLLKYPNTDWWGLLFQNALQHKHNLSIAGGNETVKSAISLTYLNQNGVLINTGSDQLGLRANTDITLKDNINVNFDLALNKRQRNAPARVDDIYWNLLHDVPPTIVSKYPDGTYQLGPTSRNPLAAAEKSGYRNNENYQGVINSSINWQPINNLNIIGRVSVREDFSEQKIYNNDYTFTDYETKATLLTWRSSLNQSSPREEYYNLQGTADYTLNVSKHNFKFLLGYSEEKNKWREIGASRNDFYSNDLQELNVGSDEGRNNWGNSTLWTLQSTFGRLNYSFDDKYLLEGNFRYDGSSRFADGRRWGFFPSFSAGYRISEETFWESIKENVPEFKIRGSWGQLGNQDIALYQYIQTISLGQNYSFGGNLARGAAQSILANQLISWETSTNTNIGVDIGLLSNKLMLTADAYRRVTDDILLVRDIPGTVGLDAPTQNVGSVKNQGWEVSLKYNEELGEDFKFNVGLNLSDVNNTILEYGEASVNGWQITREREPIGSLFGYVTEGLFQSVEEVSNHAFQHTITGPGDIKYKDINGDNIINDLDKVVLGSTIPRYTYGINLGASYKNWDVNLFFNGVGKSYGFQEGALIEGPIWDGFTTKEMLDRWTPDNREATWPRLVYQTIHNEQPSDWWIQKTSFFRLKNFQLGYKIPQNFINKIGIKGARTYISGENVFTLTNAKNLDPEFPSGRATYYPQTKIFSFGLNLTF